MGRLAGLELHNFKSYKGTAKVGFGDSSFTSIIGPNGAGKSNMLDAISFVLGIQSSQLRSNQLRDLIYRGRVEQPQNAGLLGVTETLEDSDSLRSTSLLSPDPTTAYVCALYEKDNGEIMKLKRTINVNGSSDYRINDINVTALQYTLALKAENILIKAKNFLVFQGDIENVAAQSPKDLSRMLETISGSAEYVAEYDQLKEEFEKTRELAAEVFSRKRNLNSESKQYKEQMRELEIFEAKLNEKYTLIKKYHLYKIFHNQKRHFQLVADVRKLTEQLNTSKSKLLAAEEQYKSMSSEGSKASLDVKRLETLIFESKSKLESLRRSMVPVKTSKKSLQTRIEITETKLEDLTRDLQSQAELAQALKNKLQLAEENLADLDERADEAMRKAQISPEGVAEYKQLRTKFLASSGSELENKLSILDADRDALISSVRNYELQKENSESRIDSLESSIRTTYQPKLAATTSNLNEHIKTKEAKIAQKESLLKNNEDLVLKEMQLASDLRQTMIKLDDLSLEQKETKKQKKLKENVNMLRNVLKDGSIKGILHELVRSSLQKYDLALQTALGANLDAIVVESTSVAYKCIDILKERRAGTATFIPVNSVVTDSVNLNYLRTLSDYASPAIDVARFEDPTIERAVMFALGDILIVDSIENARDLKWNYSHVISNKLVTLEGEVIHKSGLMTGGQHINKSSASSTWTKQNLVKLTNQKDELVSELGRLQADKSSVIEINSLTEEIASLDESIQQCRSKISSLERDVSERQLEVTFYQEQKSNYTALLEVKMSQVAELDAQIEATKAQIGAIQETIYRDFCIKHNLESINEYEVLSGPGMRARARERAELLRSISSLKNLLNLHTENSAETQLRVERLRADLNKLSEDLLAITCQWEDMEADYAAQESKIAELNDRKEEVAQSYAEILRSTKALEDEIEDSKADVRATGKDVVYREEALLKVDSERLNLLKNCKIENVDLPLENGFLDSISLETSGDISSVAYSVYVDYSLLDLSLQDKHSVKAEAELKVKIEDVEKELQALTPNANAMERLREVDSKIKNFDREFTKARQNEKRASTRFNEVKQLRTELFMNAFAHISDRIDGVYKELTRYSASVGGSAYLTLEDEDEPYAGGIRYHAMPPMKRFRDMDLLSGGEKTMAALALLFAVHSFHPSPFFVLDEIDAALDNSNVAKIASYMKRHAGVGLQFIVISLKSSLFENSDALVGIYREQRENTSKTVTLDLRNYQTASVEVDIKEENAAVPV